MAHRVTVGEESRQDSDARNLTPAQLAADPALTGTYAQIVRSTYNALDGPQTVDRTGVTATDVPLQAAINAAAASVMSHRESVFSATTQFPISRTLFIPDGEYKLNAPLTWPLGISIEMSPGAKLKAASSMGAIISTDTAVLHEREFFRGGILDCNGLAQTGLSVGYFAHMVFDDITIHQQTQHGMILGDPAAASTSYEAIVRNLDIWRPRTDSVPAGYYGLWCRSLTDSRVELAHIVGVDTGIRNDGADNHFVMCHVWNTSSTPTPVGTAFDDNGTGLSYYLQCYADSANAYGFRARNGFVSILGCMATLSPTINTDNVCVGFKSDQATASFYINGLRLVGADGSHRFAKDIDMVDTAATGAEWYNVNDNGNIVARFDGVRSRSRGLRLRSVGIPTSSPLLVSRASSGATAYLQQWTNENTVGLAAVSAAGELFSVGRGGSVRSVSADTTVTTSDDVILVSAAATITLPSASSSVRTDLIVNPMGRRYTIRNTSGAASVTVAASAGNVDGAATATLTTGTKATYVSDGANWWSV